MILHLSEDSILNISFAFFCVKSGYMAPEYAMEGIYSIKSDVFSFGVLLIEIISGKRNASFSEMEDAPSLLAYVSYFGHN